MAKRPVPLYDFKAFGAAIKAARNEYGESRKKVSDELYISPRYLANIENKGQQPSLQVFYDLVTRYHISVDQFFFPNSNAEKSTGRRQLDALLDGMSDKGIRIVTATAREITEVEKAEDYQRIYQLQNIFLAADIHKGVVVHRFFEVNRIQYLNAVARPLQQLPALNQNRTFRVG